jgi:maltose/maltodextrin transport system permease protein
MDVIKKKHWWQSDALKWSVLGLLGLLVGYLVVLMYAQGEYLFAITTLILSSAGLYIFANRKAYAWRYVYPGMAGMGLFVLFPLVCTIAIAFTNYSSTNQLTFERAQEVLLDRSWQAGKTYNFGLYPAGDEWQLALSDGETGKNYLSDAFKFGGEQKLQLKETTAQPEGERANLRVITQNRQALSDITAILPDGNKVMMSSLRQFSGTQPLYTLDGDGTLTNNQSGVKYRPNNQIGFYQSITADGNWGDEKLSPGYTVTTGWKNFTRVFTDEGIQKPFLAIFVWTVVFSLKSVRNSRKIPELKSPLSIRINWKRNSHRLRQLAMALTLSSGHTTALVATLNLACWLKSPRTKRSRTSCIRLPGMPYVTTAS